MRYNERQGHWPLMKAKATPSNDKVDLSSSDEEAELGILRKPIGDGNPFTEIRSVKSGSST